MSEWSPHDALERSIKNRREVIETLQKVQKRKEEGP